MNKEGIYELSPKQTKAFMDFRVLGEKNKKRIIAAAVDFLRGELRFDERTGGSIPAVVGVSGGIDSAVVLALAAKALGRENVIAVEMPYRGRSSQESTDFADELIRGLEIERVYRIPINGMVDAEVTALCEAGVELGAFEIGNVMARMRMVTLYGIANKFGGRVLDTCNLTEVMMGYFTKFGDGASDLNPVGEIYKTWMWIIAAELGVPENIIKRKPSAELMGAAQSDEKDMGIGYSALDLMLYLKNSAYTDNMLVKDAHFPREVVDRVDAAIAMNLHKRKLPPVGKIGI